MAQELPDSITRETLLQAISKFDSGFEHAFSPSTTYDLVFEGKAYPPKAIVGIAGEIITGVAFVPDDFSGGVESKCFRILEQNGFKIVQKASPTPVMTQAGTNPIFTKASFDLLARLSANPTKIFYEAHKDEIGAHINTPLKNLFGMVEQRMPDFILLELETKKRILSQVLKNDYGAGGAYDYIWGAFYRKGLSKTTSPQLFITIAKDHIGFGFYIGEADRKFQRTFRKKCKDPVVRNIAADLDNRLRGLKIGFGEKKPDHPIAFNSFHEFPTFGDWLDHIDEVGVGARVLLAKEEATQLSADQLADKVADVFKMLYPLFQHSSDYIKMEYDDYTENEYVKNNKEAFEKFLSKIVRTETSTIARYTKSLDTLAYICSSYPLGYDDCADIWSLDHKSVSRLIKLLECLKNEKKLGSSSEWNNFKIAKYFLHDGFFHAALSRYIDFLNERTSINSCNYWTWAAGEGAEHWNDFYKAGIMAIGWDSLGDLCKYESKDEVQTKLQELGAESQASSQANNALACWQFREEIKKGDIIFSKKGTNTILGYGIVEGDYTFDTSRAAFQHTRKVKWVKNGEWVLPDGEKAAIKTLTNVSKYTDFVNQIKNLVGLITPISSSIEVPANPQYSIEQCADESGFSKEDIEVWIRAIHRKGQAIVYGAPGTGKTFIAEKLSKHLIGEGDGFFDLIQFHPAYSYEDFIEGIRPETTDGQLSYSPMAGRFLNFCKMAADRTGTCVLIIDEINRANLARVFGELMYLLEYRNREIVLAGGTKFSIPNNVRIIGTMNTADKSIAIVDHALRRRFSFIPLAPNYEVLKKFHTGKGFDPDKLIDTLKRINNLINDSHFHIGISFFLKEDLANHIKDIWQFEIEPYLEEFFIDQIDKIQQFRWSDVKDTIISQ